MNKTSSHTAGKSQVAESNRMPKSGGRTVFDIVRDHVLTYFNLLSLVIFVLLLFTGSYRNTLFIGVVVSNAVIGICQELYLKSKLDKLKTVRQTHYTVIREEKSFTLSSEEIIKGDILSFTAGEEIPCDMEILSTQYIEVNEALLTGESNPIAKKVGDTLSGGSFVVSGSCRAKAIRVGSETYHAKMMLSAGKYERSRSLILEGIEKIIKVMSLVILPLGILLFLSTYYRDTADWRAAVVTTAAGIIGMIPSGLYLITTVTSTTAVLKLARKQAVVNDFSGVEALSRVTTLCLDKTGTLTTGEIQVTKVISYDEAYEDLLCLFCKAFPVRNPTLEGIYQAFGDETLRLVEEIVPFSSERKYSQVVSEGVCYRLGAAEQLVCEQEILDTANQWIAKGNRVLALANDEKCLALVVMEEVIKPQAKEVLGYFREQKLELKLISGDHPKTVSAIAKALDFNGWNSYIDLSLEPKTPEHYRNLVKRYSIFGRATPNDKALLIRVLTESGEQVCMVGDGVNDILAMKEASLSVSMASGDQATKSVSQIVLGKSDFSPMPDILREGRRIVNNIERVAVMYLLKTAFSLMITVLCILMGTNYPFAPISKTVIGALTIGIPSFFLALEPNDKPVHEEFLPSVLRFAIPTAVLIALFVGFFGLLESVGYLPYQETLCFYVTAYFCFFQLISCSRPVTAFQLVVILTMLVIFFVCVFLPGFLPLGSLSFADFILLGACLCVGTVLLNRYHAKIEKEEA